MGGVFYIEGVGSAGGGFKYQVGVFKYQVEGVYFYWGLVYLAYRYSLL